MSDENSGITTTDAPIGLDDVLIAQAVGKPYVLLAVGQYSNGDPKIELSMKDLDESLARDLLLLAAEGLRLRG